MLISLLQSLILYYTFAITLVLTKEISFRDSNIEYIGRWKSQQDQITSGWPGAYFKVTLQQTRFIKLQLTQPTSLTVFINKVEFQFQNISHTEPLDLVPQGLVDDGPHDLMVVASNLDTYQVSIYLQAILVDEAASTVAPETNTTALVEFVGHDLTLGVGATRTLFSSFAWLTSRELLNLDTSLVAYRNAKLVDGIENKYFDWSLDTTTNMRQPWSVVILLGANDRQANVSAEDYKKSLHHFVTKVRKTLFENAPIFILCEPLGDMFRPSQQSVIDLTHQQQGGDQYVYFIDTTAWIRYGPTYYLDSGHLNDAGHLLLAKKLAPLLEIKLTHPRDPLPGPPPNPNLPGDWQTMDVGQETRIGLPGTVSADSASTFTLWGSGADIDNDKDAFRFVYQPFGNTGILESTIRSHSTFAKCAKAGIMIREHLGHGSPLIMLGISPAEGIFVQVRYGNFETTKLIKKKRASPPWRLRLIRQNDMFEAQIQHPSADNNAQDTWETFATVPFVLARDVYAGLAVTSCDTSVVSVAKFTEVALYHSASNIVSSSSSSYLDSSSTQPRFIDQH